MPLLIRTRRTRALVTQNDAPWGIASLSVPSLPNGDKQGQKYTYDSTAGAGTFAYVFDTGNWSSFLQ